MFYCFLVRLDRFVLMSRKLAKTISCS